ncbi:transposase [Desulfurococcaceae archaeon AG1]|jgi:hypothetical protein|nr:transposase [Desulfurococcaceae archaeon AG1]
MPESHSPANTWVFKALKDIVPGVGLSTQAPGGDGSIAPSCLGHKLDGSRVPFGSTAAHDPARSLILWVEVEVPGCDHEQI